MIAFSIVQSADSSCSVRVAFSPRSAREYFGSRSSSRRFRGAQSLRGAATHIFDWVIWVAGERRRSPSRGRKWPAWRRGQDVCHHGRPATDRHARRSSEARKCLFSHRSRGCSHSSPARSSRSAAHTSTSPRPACGPLTGGDHAYWGRLCSCACCPRRRMGSHRGDSIESPPTIRKTSCSGSHGVLRLPLRRNAVLQVRQTAREAGLKFVGMTRTRPVGGSQRRRGPISSIRNRKRKPTGDPCDVCAAIVNDDRSTSK